MSRFLANRLLQGVATLVLVSVIVFALSRATGDPALLMLPFTASPEEIQAMRARLGTDQPVPIQYARYLTDILQGDFGNSIRLRRPVVDLLADHLPASLALAGVALLAGALLGIPAGLAAALRRGRLTDGAIRTLGLVGLSVPAFWLGIMAIEVFSVRLGLFPTSGIGGPEHYALPAGTMALFAAGGIMRLTRATALEVMQSSYIVAARARGIPFSAIVRRHVVKNSLLPVAGLIGVYFPLLVSSAVVIETVFAWPGIGRLAYQAIVARDFPVIQGVVLAGSAIVVVSSFAIDLVYGALDPRIHYDR